MEKLLIECTLELFAAGRGRRHPGPRRRGPVLRDLASWPSAGDGGMHVDLDRVPLRDSSLAPEEILMSESQERMMAVVEPGDVARFLAICAKWDVEAVVDRRGHRRPAGCVIDWHGETRRRRPPALGGARRPDVPPPLRPPRLAGRAAGRRGRGAAAAGRRRRAARDACCGSPARPTSATSRGSPTSTTATCRATPCSPSRRDAGMVRVDEDTHLGVAVATDGNGRFAKLDPYAGAQLALAEAYRNVACGGAMPLAVSRLPELRLARGPGGDVAVRRGLPRAQGRLPRARHPGHRRQRRRSTTRPARPRSCRRRWSRCSA